MKKRSLLLLAASMFMIAGCSQGVPQDPYAPVVTNVAANPTSVTVELGGTPEPVSYSVNGQGPYNKEVTIESKNTSIATVEFAKGKREFNVTPVGRGETEVSVKSVGDPSKVATVKVFVINKGEHVEPYVDSVSLSKNSASYVVNGEGESIQVTVSGELDYDKGVTLSVKNAVATDLTPANEILTVDKETLVSGESFTVTPQGKAGRVQIDVISNGDPTKFASFNAMVEEDLPPHPDPKEPGVYLYPMSKDLFTEDELDIKATVVGEASISGWSSTNTEIATVSNGHVVTLKEGEVDIKCELSDGTFNICHLVVKEDPLLTPQFDKKNVDLYIDRTISVGVTCKSALTISNFQILNSNPESSVSIRYDADNNALKITGLLQGTCQIKVINGEKEDIMAVNCLGEVPGKKWMFYPSDEWRNDGAVFWAHFWGGDEDTYVKLNSVGTNGLFSCKASALLENVQFVRCSPDASEEFSWDKAWNQTIDYYIKDQQNTQFDVLYQTFPDGPYDGEFIHYDNYLNVVGGDNDIIVFDGEEKDILVSANENYTWSVTSEPQHAYVTAISDGSGIHVSYKDNGETTVHFTCGELTKDIKIVTKTDTRARREVILNANIWDTDNAWFFIHAWGGEEAASDVKFISTGKDSYYSCKVLESYTDFCLVRMDPEVTKFPITQAEWLNIWGKTNDGKFTLGINLITITEWSGEPGIANYAIVTHEHAYEYVNNDIHECLCGMTGAHEGGTRTESSGAICDICHHVYTYPLPHTHVKEFVNEVPPTCKADGMKAHYKCTVNGCTSVFDKDDQDVEVTPASLVISRLAHSYGADHHCTGCGELDPLYCVVKFVVNYDTQADGDLYFLGTVFGWSPNENNKMNWSDGNNWYIEITLKIGEQIGCKFYRSRKGGGGIWERDGEGNERRYTPTVSKTETWSWGSY